MAWLTVTRLSRSLSIKADELVQNNSMGEDMMEGENMSGKSTYIGQDTVSMLASRGRFRIHVSEAGVHRPTIAGIAGKSSTPAVSIVLAAGYPEDEDYGDEFIYTRSGGYTDKSTVQISDQELTRQNMSLARACDGTDQRRSWRRGNRLAQELTDPRKRGDTAACMSGGSGSTETTQNRRPGHWKASCGPRELGLIMYDPDGADADGRCHTLRKSTESLVRILPNAVLRELIRLDAANDRIWTEILNGTYYGELEFLEEVAKNMFVCAVCQELVQMPVTTPCGHNACAKCLCSLLCHSTKCPCESEPGQRPHGSNTLVWTGLGHQACDYEGAARTQDWSADCELVKEDLILVTTETKQVHPLTALSDIQPDGGMSVDSS
ncbi:hypothetical protein DL89DRAFT_285136 [Linderina pennispora]|uniref:RING-type domain-containing protein n=1 Tax=Linderina pennispora TaxID=61395 RepID=A0A1Y1W4Q8_9FUNG|nr:uncharacterized protein DL89DRAFT_285136 [Linderina pennispora]ORX68382.1 hypothetical protein DL89DRAFT_285136 [Linderina pennispora]